jgi:biopolymer transport protein ExbD
MAMSAGPLDGDDSELNSTINTTPLVDVMLVLLIIFLITIPVVTHDIKVTLPPETNAPLKTKPENINLSVTKDGDYFWNFDPVDNTELLDRLKSVATKVPQPELLIRGDSETQYHYIGRVVLDAQRMGIEKIDFVTQPPPRG